MCVISVQNTEDRDFMILFVEITVNFVTPDKTFLAFFDHSLAVYSVKGHKISNLHIV